MYKHTQIVISTEMIYFTQSTWKNNRFAQFIEFKRQGKF